ncbi:MAG: hypothetical protein CYPHOPRED_002609 [Cyphobasidiales sp. Tagirdzhanova-0007]|nr:MAG: hypothetical protein CYPHOPRED_002609 [Cyphobasidiales sp. Tagirdzhanova-0007]
MLPVTPTSATSSFRSSSDPDSPSTAPTSIPPSPRGKKHALVPGSKGFVDVMAGASRISANLPVTPSAVRPFLVSKNYVRTTSLESRNRSYSHSTSDGDESAGCSTVSGLSGVPPLGRRRKKGANKKSKESSLDTAQIVSQSKGRSASQTLQPATIHQIRKSSAPALISLDLEQRSEKKNSLTVPSDTLAPPRSPRPPTTTHLGRQEGHESPPSIVSGRGFPFTSTTSTPDDIPFVIPPCSPTKLDWCISDLLLRCGISNGPVHHRSQPSFAGPPTAHPVVLQPRSPCPLSGVEPIRPSMERMAKAPATLPASALSSLPAASTPLQLFSENRRESRRSERKARYEAFRQLALMAVESPSNPFADDLNGAVRLGEYKRGFDDSEIWKWIKSVAVVEPGRQSSRRIR